MVGKEEDEGGWVGGKAAEWAVGVAMCTCQSTCCSEHRRILSNCLNQFVALGWGRQRGAVLASVEVYGDYQALSEVESVDRAALGGGTGGC